MTRRRARTGRSASVVLALVAVRVVVVLLALHGAATTGRRTVLPGDARRFHQIAVHPGTPYADFAVEYPPITLAAIEALNGGTVRGTTVRLIWSQVALDVVIAALVAWGWGRRAALFYLVLGLAFVWYPFVYMRLDLVSVALAIGGLALARRKSLVGGAALVALACFAKVWPVALGPGFAVRRAWRAAATFVGVIAVGVATWVRWVGVSGPVQVLTFRGARGWQIESTVGSVLHVLAGTKAHLERGAARIGVVPTWARLGLPLLGLGIVVAVWLLVARVRSCDPAGLDGLGPVAAITGLLLCATILSPQYAVWLLPFAAIAAAAGEHAVGWLAGVALFLSTLGLNLVKELNAGMPVPMAVVLLRNMVLVALLVVAVMKLVQLGRGRPDRDAPVPPVGWTAQVRTPSITTVDEAWPVSVAEGVLLPATGEATDARISRVSEDSADEDGWLH